MSSFRTARVGRSGESADLDRDHSGYAAASSDRTSPDPQRRASAPLNRQAGPDAARIRKCIEQIYARQNVLDESGASRAILRIAVTPERGAFIADLCRAERPAATLEVGMAWDSRRSTSWPRWRRSMARRAFSRTW